MLQPQRPSGHTAAASEAPKSRTGDRAWRTLAVATLLSSVAGGELLRLYLLPGTGAALAAGGLLGFCVLGQRHFKLRERLLLAASVALSGLAFAVHADPAATIHAALDRAGFLAAFMLLLGVLREAAATSPAVVASGRYLTQQPPKRRYGAIAGGSHLLTVLLNLGALSLLAPLITAGVRAGRDAGDPAWIAEIKQRRQICANLRGFSVAIVWAPTTVTQALLANLFPGADTLRVILSGLGFATGALLLGWIEDGLRWRRVRQRLAKDGARPRYPGTPPPWRALGGFAAVCASLAALAGTVTWTADVETVPALMLAAPVLTLGWIAWQHAPEGPRAAAGAAGRRGAEILGRAVPAASPEAITLACAGYIGVMLAALVPSEVVAAVAAPEVLPPVLLLALLPLAVVLATHLALTPIVMAVFLGTALGGIAPLPVAPELLILALSGGWALAFTASPFASGALILNRMTGIAATDLTWRWNGLYSVLAYALLVAVLVLLNPLA